MKALYYKDAGRKNAGIMEIPIPKAGPKEVVIKVISCGICIGVEAEHDKNGTSLSEYPVVPGHEFSGIITEVGSEVENFCVGDRVTADNTVPCGECYYCKKNKPLHCRNFGSIGHNIHGGMAEYVLVSEKKVYKIPDHVSFNEAAMAEPVGCCIHAMDQLNIQYGDEVVVLGAGPQGMILAQLAQHSNASKVVVIGSTQEKLDILEKLGIQTILMDRNDYSKHEKALYEMMPYGADCLIDATGAQELVCSAPNLMKMGGRILGYGYYHNGEDLKFPFSDFWDRECTYLSTLSQTGDFDRAVDAIATGKVNTKVLLTAEYDLDHYFEALDRNMTDRSVIKIIIHP